MFQEVKVDDNSGEGGAEPSVVDECELQYGAGDERCKVGDLSMSGDKFDPKSLAANPFGKSIK